MTTKTLGDVQKGGFAERLGEDVLVTAIQQGIQYQTVVATLKVIEEARHVSVNATVSSFENGTFQPSNSHQPISDEEIGVLVDRIKKTQSIMGSTNSSRSSNSRQSRPKPKLPDSSSTVHKQGSGDDEITWNDVVNYINIGYNKFTDTEFIKPDVLNDIAEKFRKSTVHQKRYRRLHEWGDIVEETSEQVGKETTEEIGERTGKKVGQEVVEEVGEQTLGRALKEAAESAFGKAIPGPLDAAGAIVELIQSDDKLEVLGEQGSIFAAKFLFYGIFGAALATTPWGWAVAMTVEIAIEYWIKKQLGGDNDKNPKPGKGWDDDANQAGETPNVDPLVLDLSGDGFKPTTLDKGVHFDLDGNGFAERINWIQGDDALLVMNKNGDGTVNDGNELFGDRYRLANGQLAKFGFEALLEQDSNGDKVIDDKDENFNRLQVWQDANQNGISEKEELRSLSQAEIAAIQLNYDKSKLASQEEVTFGNSAKFIKANGETGDATEYWVKKRGYDTKMLKDVDIPLDVMFLLSVA